MLAGALFDRVDVLGLREATVSLDRGGRRVTVSWRRCQERSGSDYLIMVGARGVTPPAPTSMSPATNCAARSARPIGGWLPPAHDDYSLKRGHSPLEIASVNDAGHEEARI